MFFPFALPSGFSICLLVERFVNVKIQLALRFKRVENILISIIKRPYLCLYNRRFILYKHYIRIREHVRN